MEAATACIATQEEAPCKAVNSLIPNKVGDLDAHVS